ncbi:SpoIIE family protein phosphatase [Streptomyces sp. NEAU-H3]|uniref:SpoIIE family protein phosphatase n=1 Tax=Streptomyces sp. NEAU-H3 TaxID=2720636 RepID=UPI00280BC6D5|nr:SpoIIE family protein phosphatase [Streptomyces sp. NEAU-H3]
MLGEIPRDSTDALVLKGQLRTALRALADLELQPDELLARLSDTVTHLAEELPGGGAPRTARCTYALYDPVARTVRVACGGHPPPLVLGPDTTVTHLDEASGPALGADDPAPFAMATRELADGSTLVLPSGDLGASLRPESLAGLLAGDATAQDLADSLFTRLAPHSDSTGTALLARTYGLGGDRTACWELPAREESAAEARRLARGWLAAHPDAIGADDLDSADLLVSELVTNAVRYGTPPLTLRLILMRHLTEPAPRARHRRGRARAVHRVPADGQMGDAAGGGRQGDLGGAAAGRGVRGAGVRGVRGVRARDGRSRRGEARSRRSGSVASTGGTGAGPPSP